MKIDIEKITAHLPEFLRATDLVECGLFKSATDVHWHMHNGTSPPFIRLSERKIVFPKQSLCEWLKEREGISKSESREKKEFENKSLPTQHSQSI